MDTEIKIKLYIQSLSCTKYSVGSCVQETVQNSADLEHFQNFRSYIGHSCSRALTYA